jgi:hypothetical protein
VVRAWLWLLLAGVSACDPGRRTGAEAALQVDDALFAAGPFPLERGGPQVRSAVSDHRVVAPGATGERLRGTLDGAATGFLIGLEGDVGHWRLPAALPEVIEPDLPTFDLRFALSYDLASGPLVLLLAAVDADGRSGPVWPLELEAQPVPAAAAELVFSLAWQRSADLDLHVIDPQGEEIWAENPSAGPRSGAEAGRFAGDAGAGCRDGSRRESVLFPRPAQGRYTVRVDVFSLCGAASAPWVVDAVWRGEVLHRAQGLARRSGTRFPHGAGAGWTVLEVEVP